VNQLRRFLKITTIAVAGWYLALFAFSIAFPYCNSGSLEGVEAACYFGSADYGQLFHKVTMLSFVGAPAALALLGAWLWFEHAHRAGAKDAF